MNATIWGRVSTAFQVICWIATFTMVSYWIYAFNLNEDLCLVDYKKYYETDSDMHPMLSLCLRNPVSEEKLKRQAHGINMTTYLRFLEGNYFAPEMLNVSYENVTIDLNEFEVKGHIFYRNGTELSPDLISDRKKFQFSFAGHWFKMFYNCYTLQVPHDQQIESFWVTLKTNTSTFLNRGLGYDTITFMHYPNQLLLDTTKHMKYVWPKRNYTDNFIMRFFVGGMEVMKRRNKAYNHCDNSGKNYDKTRVDDRIRKVGCRAPYHPFSPSVRMCSTKEEMKNIILSLNTEDNGTLPPCKTMTKVSYTYEESESINKSGMIWIGILFSDKQFKEILQTR